MRSVIDEWYMVTTIDDISEGIRNSKSKRIARHYIHTLLNDRVIGKFVHISEDCFKIFFHDGRSVVMDYDGDIQ